MKPKWSVMLPVYNPTSYLVETLLAVLKQDPGSEKMQIEVIDDASPNSDVEAMVRSCGGDRISYYRQSKNLGLAGAWNSCIERAKGDLIHILHQDDLIEPDFYESLGRAFYSDRVGMAFSRCKIIDDLGRDLLTYAVERSTSGILDNWLERSSLENLILCPSVIVPKRVYESIGGYRQDLSYLLDWEMWVRIAAKYDVWFEPRILASFRVHNSSESKRLAKDRMIESDYSRLFRLWRHTLPPNCANALSKRAFQHRAMIFANQARCQFASGNFIAFGQKARQALKFDASWYVLRTTFGIIPRMMMQWSKKILRIP